MTPTLSHTLSLDPRAAFERLPPLARFLVLGGFSAGVKWPNDVYVAMEHVEGTTLTRWLDDTRPWSEIVDLFGNRRTFFRDTHPWVIQSGKCSKMKSTLANKVPSSSAFVTASCFKSVPKRANSRSA